jgi:hypothetical protein
MANTVSILSYANTFGNWLINTNVIAGEINRLGKGNYTKDTGLLILNSPGTGLQVSNNALFTSNVTVTGVGQALQVTNDAIIGGNVRIYQDTTTDTLHANVSFLGGAYVIGDMEVGGNIYANTVIALNSVTINSATINTINTASNVDVGGDLGVAGNTFISGDLTVLGNTNLKIENVSMDEMITGNLAVNGTLSGNGVSALEASVLSSALALSVALG